MNGRWCNPRCCAGCYYCDGYGGAATCLRNRLESPGYGAIPAGLDGLVRLEQERDLDSMRALLARWPKLLALHLPAAVWGAYIELSGGICPLTPLENHFRTLGGGSAYGGDFVERAFLFKYVEGREAGGCSQRIA